MDLFPFLLSQRGRLLSRFLKTQTLARLITILLFLSVFAGVGWVVYEGLYQGLQFVNQDPSQAQAVTLYLYELASLVLAVLVAASTALTGLPTLFQGRRDVWVAVSPRPGFLFAYRAAGSLLASLWPVLLLALPASLAATRLAPDPSLTRFLLSLGAYALLTVCIASLTLAVSLLLARLLGPALKPGRLAALLGALAIICGAATWQWIRHSAFTALFSSSQLAASQIGTQAIAERFRFLPTHLAAETLLSLQTGQSSIGAFLLLCALAAFSLLALAGTGRLYPRIWQALQEGRFQASSKPQSAGKPRLDGSLSRTTSPTAALVIKEALSLVRERKNALWLVFLLIVWLVQAGLLRSLGPKAGQVAMPGQLAFLQAAQMLVSLYFVATLVLRFAFPAFSLEGRTAWALASAPISLRKVFLAKYLAATGMVALVGAVIGLGNLALLGISGSGIALSLGCFLLASAFLVALGLTIGTYFPNFDTEDPELLTTTLPGIAVTLLAIGYGAALAVTLYWMLADANGLPLELLIGASVVGLGILLVAGSAHAENLELGTSVR
jgi:hypothetical protein